MSEKHRGSGPPHLAPGLAADSAPRLLWSYALFLLGDGLIVGGAFGIGLLLRFDGQVPPHYAARFPLVALALIALYIGANRLLGIYWRGWRYAGLYDVVALGQAVGLATAVAYVVNAVLYVDEYHPLPLGVVPIGGVLTFVGTTVVRFRHRLVQTLVVAFTKPHRQRLLIVGAGQAGQWLARELLATPVLGYNPVCFVDDDPAKLGQRIHGLPVAGTRLDIRRLVEQLDVEIIALAIPSISLEARREIVAQCTDVPARIKIMPGIPDLLAPQASGAIFLDARLEDLLGRPPVQFASRDGEARPGRVMVTGAAGSIGAELARQLAALGPRQLILLDTNESGLFDLAADLEQPRAEHGIQIELAVADVTLAQRIDRLFQQYRPTMVFHAAAYKHVPLMEAHPEEAVLTNVVGTLNVCQSAERWECERVVFISSDKAVAPSNVMGATKRAGERIIQSCLAASATTACAVRFGNVLGSRGSVVPTFARQIAQGGPVTITHREMSRFFMTIPEAVNLIIEASRLAEGGEIFILDMGKPVGILDLAHKMIRLHGMRPGDDIEIREIGPRPGEKLHEALTDVRESLVPTSHPRITRVSQQGDPPLERDAVICAIGRLRGLAELGQNDALVRELSTLANPDLSALPPHPDRDPSDQSARDSAAQDRRASEVAPHS